MIDNVGELDDVDFSAMDDDDIRQRYNEIGHYNAERFKAWSSGKPMQAKVSTRPGLAWAMHQAGEAPTKIAKTLGLDMSTLEWYLRI